MEIKSLAGINFETIAEAFTKAFSDYAIQMTAADLMSMCQRRGFDPGLSFAAFEGEEIVSFTLNGIGEYNGVKMAYDTGTGTLKAYRGQGLATRIFTHSIPYLKAANIHHYLLEVLQQNAKAISIYQKIGFEVTREFNYFVWKNEALNNPIKEINSPFSIEPIALEKHELITSFWDYQPSWQNSFESIQRASEKFSCLGAFADGALVGYVVFEPIFGDITQLAVDRAHRRKGIGSLLLHEISQRNQHTKMKLINAETTCDSLVAFLKAKGIEIGGKQLEMRRGIG